MAAIKPDMTSGHFSSKRWRAAIGLIAAYAIALQAVFTTLAPMPAYAAGGADPFGAYCFGNGSGSSRDSGVPAGPSPVSAKMHCVFCGACAAGFVVPPSVAVEPRPQAAGPIAFAPPASTAPLAADNPRDGPARAPPHVV